MRSDKFNFYQSPKMPKSNKKYLYSMAAVFVLAALIISPFISLAVFSSTASGYQLNPRFNIFTPYTHEQTEGHDYYLLDVKNNTQGTSWGSYFVAQPGDVLTFSVYYHNGVLNTVAGNTTLKVSLPQNGDSYYQNVTAYLWADNAENATPANPMTQSLTIRLTSQTSLQVIDGSVKWFPNQKNSSDPPTPLPYGQNGSELFGAGLRIGDILGCWEYSGFVNFQVKVLEQIPPPPPPTLDLSISKQVKNISNGQTFYSETTSADPGDQVSFQIRIQNTGNGALNNLYFHDSLPYYLNYNAGSATIDGNNLSDSFITTGVNIGSLGVGNSHTIVFTASVSSSASNQTLINTAYARADRVSEKNDSATVYVNQIIPPTLDLSISKQVKNISNGQTFYSETTSADPGDQVSFQIRIQNTGNGALNNLYFHDSLPYYLNYNAGSATIDGNNLSDSFITTGVNIGSLGVGNSHTIVFTASVSSSASNQTLINTAYARADRVSEKNDSATVYVNQIIPPQGNLNLSKYVKNITAGQTSLNTYTNANLGDRLFFSIQVAAYGQQLNNIRVWDALPPGISYVSGTTRIDGAYATDFLFSGGLSLGSLYSGQSRNITFEATVNSNTYYNQTLTNYAYASADNASQQSAQARVFINQAPAPPSIVKPTGFTKSVANITYPNGTNTDNQARPGEILQYTLSYTNNTGATLNNVEFDDVLPAYTIFLSVTSGNGFYDSSKNEVIWNLGTLLPGNSVTVSYQVKVASGPVNYVITNSALMRSSSAADVISNEVRTTISAPAPPAPVKAVTGSNSLRDGLIFSGLLSLLFTATAYFVLKNPDYLRMLKLKWKIFRIKTKESII